VIVAERLCELCHRRFYAKNGQHRYCTPACREKARARAPFGRARYGYQHQEVRRRVARHVASGNALCARCGLPIDPTDAWDLDHTDDGSGYLGASHASCNRATNSGTAGRNGHGPQALKEDDPQNGVFWGPPDEDGYQPRWSRVWFEWRGGEA
jgi:hypothetical protein